MTGKKHSGRTRRSGDKTPLQDIFPKVSRRRFTKASAVAPLIMTLQGRSAWGAQCESGFHSGNLSNQAPPECAGYGCTPGFWKENLEAWESTVKIAGISYGTCREWNNAGKCKAIDATVSAGATSFFLKFGLESQLGANLSLMEVLQHPGQTAHNLDFHAVAAYLNAVAFSEWYGWTPEGVIAVYQAATNGTPYGNRTVTPEEAALNFDELNNRGCPLDAHGCGLPVSCVKVTDQSGTTKCYKNVPTAYDGKTGECVPVITKEIKANNVIVCPTTGCGG